MTRTFDPALISFLPVSVVQAELAHRGAKITKVTFLKKDGTTTTRVGMPKVYTRRVGGEKGPAATAESVKRAETAARSLAENQNIWMDYARPDLNEGKKGFSFNLGRVVAIGDEGTHPAA